MSKPTAEGRLKPNVAKRTSSGNAVKAAATARKAATETLEEAWERILALKNDEATKAKLGAVKRYMDAGQLGREAESAHKKFSKAEALRLYAIVAEREREGKLAELVANTPPTYRLITELSELDELVAKAAKEDIIAVDTETTGLDVYTDVIVGVSLSLPNDGNHYYIAIKPTEDERAMDADEAFKRLKPIIEDAALGKVLHNAPYDMAMFERHGIKMRGLAWDTLTAMHLLNENEPTMQLKVLASKYLREPSDTFAELFGKDAKFAEIPLDVALVYGAKDTDVTWRLYEFQRMHLEKMPTVMQYLQEVEIPLISAIYDMERTGFVIDVEYAEKYGKEMKAQIDTMEKSLLAQLGDINLNSTQQLKPVLEAVTFEVLPNLDAKKTLQPLAAEHEVIAELLEYRKLKKLYGTYISVLPELIHPVTGRFHVRMNPNGAKTGRFSSGGSGANMQNQPQDARPLFIAAPGKVIIGADFSAQEVRCVAALSGEPALVQAFKDGKDAYATMASKFFDKPYEDVYKDANGDDTKERKMMKTAYLASLYGTGPNTLAKQLKTTPQDAKKFLDDFFKNYKYIRKWIDDTHGFLQRNGYVWIGDKMRKRRLPDAKGSGKKRGYDAKVEGAKRQGPNARVQGLAAIQTKVTLVELHRWIQTKPGWSMWLTVHDEILLEAPEDVTREEVAEFERIMVESFSFGEVGNGTDIEIGKRWGQLQKLDEWFENEEVSAIE